MAPLACSFRFGSPGLSMSPESIHQGPFGMASYEQSARPSNTVITSPSMNPFPQPCSLSALRPSSHQAVGRKRSRDEAGTNLSIHHELQKDAKYGEGMSVFKRNRGYIANSNAQRSFLANRPPQETPFARNGKSRRLDHTEQQASTTKTTMPKGPALSVTEVTPASVSSGNMQPVVDDFTLHLGIGWRKISDDEHIQAAARGWSRYIENHYPLSSVTILLESRGLQAYLVESAEGFFLFSEDLRKGRLVSTRVEVALQNLKCSPPVFEGQDTLVATDTPEIGTTEAQGFRHEYQPDMAMEMA
ncbi:hypothetical protein ACRALDRAFT_2050107 [Sodiomyces alcalophilus JCM 7366]|uniref:uncharacterized protein n=1 Tax=Sodiomyces alcalophilus JCM 7366 TaxID=591952 RepID=UPI0039B3D53F